MATRLQGRSGKGYNSWLDLGNNWLDIGNNWLDLDDGIFQHEFLATFAFATRGQGTQRHAKHNAKRTERAVAGKAR